MPAKTRQKSNNWNFDLSLHDKQLEVFFDESKMQVMVCGRRFGKSHLQVNRIAHDAIAFNQLMPDYDIKSQTMETVILAGMPTLKQAKKIIWKPLLKIFKNCPLVEDINKTDNIIRFAGNYPEIHVVGLNDADGDRARGLKLWRSNLDEVQDVKASVIDTVILPAMADTPRSRGFFTGTPKGKVNHLYGLFMREQNEALKQLWRSFNFATADNPFIPREEIELAKATLSPRLFDQEFGASFVNFEGAIFSEFDTDIHVLPVNRLPQTWDSFYIGHDCGDVNPAIVLIGLSAKKYYVLEAIQLGDGVNPVPSDVLYSEIEGLCYKYGEKVYRAFVDPSRPGVIHDLRSVGRQKNIAALKRTIAGFNRIEEGNNVVNNLYHQDRLFVSAACPKSFIDEITSYHRLKDSRSEQITEKVAPNQKDHRIDSARYCLATLHNMGARTTIAHEYGAA